jgi:cyclohexanecarboxylate-CoA ligase
VTTAVSAARAEVMLVPGRLRGTDYEAMAAGLRLDGLDRPRVIVVDEAAPESDHLAALPAPPADPDQARWVYFTSGSTGLPKGVRHADRGLLLMAGDGFAPHGRLGERADEMAAIAVQIAHVGGV